MSFEQIILLLALLAFAVARAAAARKPRAPARGALPVTVARPARDAPAPSLADKRRSERRAGSGGAAPEPTPRRPSSATAPARPLARLAPTGPPRDLVPQDRAGLRRMITLVAIIGPPPSLDACDPAESFSDRR